MLQVVFYHKFILSKDMDKKYYVYIILTKDKQLYCGFTDDVEKRFQAHLDGKGAKYTRAHKPDRIIYTACFDTKPEAMKEKYRIKQLSRVKKVEFLKELNINIEKDL